MSATTEQDMLDAIKTHIESEGWALPKVHAVQIRLIADNGPRLGRDEEPNAGRIYYQCAGSFSALVGLAAPFFGVTGTADAPIIPTYQGVTAQPKD